MGNTLIYVASNKDIQCELIKYYYNNNNYDILIFQTDTTNCSIYYANINNVKLVFNNIDDIFKCINELNKPYISLTNTNYVKIIFIKEYCKVSISGATSIEVIADDLLFEKIN